MSALSHPRTALVEEGSCVVGPLLLPLLPAVLRRGGATGVVVGCGAGDGDGALATRGEMRRRGHENFLTVVVAFAAVEMVTTEVGGS